MHNTRTAVGVALLVSLALILCSGFARPSGQEFVYIIAGFVTGLVTAYLIDHLKPRSRAGAKGSARGARFSSKQLT